MTCEYEWVVAGQLWRSKPDLAFLRLAHLALVGSIRQREARRLADLIDDSSSEEDALETLALLRRLVGEGEA